MAASARPEPARFWAVVIAVIVADVITKLIAVRTLVPIRAPREVIGEWLRWTLVYNPGAAFGLHLGPYSRWIFMVLTVVALVILWKLYGQTREGDTLRITSLALVSGGAVGNLIDRVRSPLGVVDFIDVGVRFGASEYRWPTFNIADMAVSTGAFLLAWVLWGEDRAAAEAAAAAQNAPPATTGPIVTEQSQA